MRSVTVEREGSGVVDVRLNRPEAYNALNDEMFEGLIEVAVSLRSDTSVRAVVLSGNGKGFCSGLDMAAFRAMETGVRWRPSDADTVASETSASDGWVLGRGQRAVWGFATLPVPVIAAVHGAAVGGGLQLALGADIRIVSPTAKLGVLETNWGLSQDMTGTQLLPRLIGADMAKWLTFTGRTVSGEEAVRIGLATRAAEDPLAEALALALEIGTKSPDAIRRSKRLLNLAWTVPLQEGFLAEREVMTRAVGSPNQREAVTAAREGRPARFRDPTQET